MRLTATIVLLPLLAIRAGTVVPEVDTSTGQVHPAVLESRITGAYLAATNQGTQAKSYAADAIATATADMVVTDELGNAITLEAARRVAGDLAGSNNVTVAVAAEAAQRVAGDLAGSNNVTSAVGAEAALRVAGDLASQSNAQAYAAALMETGTAFRATAADYATSAGTAGTATNATYVLGDSAWITMSGSTGLLYRVETNTNVIRVVSNSVDYSGPMGPFVWDGLLIWGTGDAGVNYSAETWTLGNAVWFGQLVAAFELPQTMEPTGAPLVLGTGTATLDWGLQTNAYAIATTADLTDALAAYSPTGHVHAISNVTGLQDALDTIPDEAEIESIAESAAETVAQTAPEWIGVTNLSAAITVTNQYERPISLYSTGTVSVAFSGLRPPQALYCVIRGPDVLTFPGAHLVGGGSWQTNAANHFLIWQYGTNLMVHPVTTTPLED